VAQLSRSSGRADDRHAPGFKNGFEGGKGIHKRPPALKSSKFRVTSKRRV